MWYKLKKKSAGHFLIHDLSNQKSNIIKTCVLCNCFYWSFSRVIEKFFYVLMLLNQKIVYVHLV